MLKNIPSILSPELLKVLMEMGHGDEIILSDGNFPAESMGKNSIVVRADGHGVNEILDAVLSLFPLDQYSEKPVALMKVVAGDDCKPIIWEDYKVTIKKHEGEEKYIDMMDRFDFYDRAKNVYAIIATGETAIYANILLKKGVIK